MPKSDLPTKPQIFRFSYYPQGLPVDVAERVAAYYQHDLSPDDQQKRFFGFFTDRSAAEMRGALVKPQSKLLLATRIDADQEIDAATDIAGTVRLLYIDPWELPEIASDTSRHNRRQGLGLTQFVDMLGLCEQDRIKAIQLEVASANHPMKHTLIRATKEDIPWALHFDLPSDGVTSATIEYQPAA